MPLSAFASSSLLEPSASRDRLHFAASEGQHLYTLQADDTLRVWSLAHALEPKDVGQLKLPLELYAPAHQFSEGRLLLWADGELAAVSLADPSQPRLLGSFALDGLRSCALVGEAVFVERYLSGEDGYGVCAVPTSVDQAPVITALLPGDDTHGTSAALLDGRLIWACQDELKLMRPQPAAFEGSLRHDSVVAYPLPVGRQRLAVLEVYDAARTAVSFVDLEGKRLRHVARFHPKALVRAWCLTGTRLWTVLSTPTRSSGKRESATSLVCFDTERPAELSSVPLPFVEVYGQEATHVQWMGVRGPTFAVLLGSGQLHRFSLGS